MTSTSTEIAIRQPATGGIAERDIIDGWIGVVSDVAKLADYIAETDFVPKGLRNRPAAIAACILTGRELGIGPMGSLKSIHMVQGVPSLSAEYKRARALAAGHQIVIDETNATRCVARGRRAGAENWLTVIWTTDMAKRAKLDGKDVWKQYPQRMLQARATGELCDLLFPDATLGLATTEELEDGGLVVAAEVVTGAVIEPGEQPAAIEPPKPAAAPARTARRRTPAAGADTRNQPHVDRPAEAASSGPTGESSARDASPRAAGAAPSRGAQPSPPQDLPPLPGEDEPGEPPREDVIQAVTDLFDELAAHADHQMKQIGRCVYCVPCNARLYQGRAPNAKERAELREYARQRQAEGVPDGQQQSAPGDDRHRKFVGIVQQHFKRLGFDDEDRGERLWAAAKIASVKDITSLNDLDHDELSTVADALAKCRDRKRLEEILAAAGEGSSGG